MPTVSVNKTDLLTRIGQVGINDDEVQKLCFAAGLELDDVVEEEDKTITFKIDVPANRYDQLSVEGIALSLNAFSGAIQPPVYTTTPAKETSVLTVDADVLAIRPFARACILRGVKFNALNYKSFIVLQDKLHMNLARNRTLSSIGTHDLSTIQGPFKYTAVKPSELKFKALAQSEEMTAEALLNLYETDADYKHLKKFVPLVTGSDKVPVILDANNVVLSLPPIINGEHSKITLETTDILIECTGTDLIKVDTTINTIAALFSQYCTNEFEVEQVTIVEASGEKTASPDFTVREASSTVEYINRVAGLNLSGEQMCVLLKKMQLNAHVEERPCSEGIHPTGKDSSDTTPVPTVVVDIPITRWDVLHAADIMEDVAIAYGFNNIIWKVAPTNTVGTFLPINKLTDLLRPEIALCGFAEALNFALISVAEATTMMNRPGTEGELVRVANPKTPEFQVCRNSLLPPLMKTLRHSKHLSLPIKLFEVSDVVLVDPSSDTGALNQRRVAALVAAKSGTFSVIHGLVDRIMAKLNVWHHEDSRVGVVTGSGACRDTYKLRAATNPMYFDNFCAEVVLGDGTVAGFVGILHPSIMAAYQVGYPVAATELNLEKFL